ncbi:hypothetical protein AB0K12_35350 [Nonomuraea sp. NPDC049419]|uniref:hypothetical protein n=1 Tax=Nonomuraea sp. NPDC049419 TaxID=3155772 RepID=UPI00344141E4
MASRPEPAPLQAYLRGLEERAKRAVPDYSRAKVIEEANSGESGVRLTTSQVADWFTRGAVPSNVEVLWSLVAQLLRYTGDDAGRVPPSASPWWRERRRDCEARWNQAREERASRPVRSPQAPDLTLLNSYLAAARDAAAEHPYPGVLPGAMLPPLPDVYIRRQARRHHPLPDPGACERPMVEKAVYDEPQSAEELIGHDGGTRVFLGGPGSGKSSLLRMALITLADRWLTRSPGAHRPPSAAPLYVPASYLTQPGSFAAQLKAATEAQLRGRHVLPLPEDFFWREPYPGKHWLVLIDGLDEIIDLRRRTTVIRLLRSHRAGPYRFVLTSRHLSDEEQQAVDNDPDMIGYDLLPLDDGRLGDLARSWISAYGSAEAHHPPITTTGDLARIPLVAAILCQIRTARPGRPLPRDRFGIYDTFLDLLEQDMYEAAPLSITQHLRNRLDHLGEQAAPAVNGLPRRVLLALGAVAAERQDGRTTDLFTAVTCAAAELRPDGLPAREWEALVVQTTHRTGLVAGRDAAMTFVHQTVADFLAARHVVGDAVLSKHAFEQLLDGPASAEPTSYHRFLILAWQRTGTDLELPAALHRLATDRRTVACVAELAREGAEPAAETVRAASALLITMAADPRLGHHARLQAALAVTALDRAGAVGALRDLVADQELRRPIRLDAARELARHDRTAAVKALGDLAAERGMAGAFRVAAAKELGELDPAAATSALRALVAESRVPGSSRVAAAQALRKLDQAAAVAALHALVADTSAWTDTRIQAVLALRNLDQAAAVSAVRALADVERGVDYYRLATSPSLRDLDAQASVAALYALACDAEQRDPYRLDAALRLRELDLATAADALGTLAADPRVSATHRCTAAEALEPLDASAAFAAFSALARGTGRVSVKAATKLAALDREAGIRLLRTLAADRRVDDSARYEAARALGLLDPSISFDALRTLAAETTLSDVTRLRAAERLAAQDPGDGAAALATMAEDGTAHGIVRVRAAETLAETDRRAGVAALAAMASDARLTGILRSRAAEALVELHPQTAAPVLHALATDPHLDGSCRLAAAEALMKLDRDAAARAFHSVAADVTVPGHLRLDAAAAVQDAVPLLTATTTGNGADAALAGQEAVPLLTAMAAETGADGVMRVRAAGMLARLDRDAGVRLLIALGETLDGEVRFRAAETLAAFDAAAALTIFRALASNAAVHPQVSRWAADAVEDLAGVPGGELRT